MLVPGPRQALPGRNHQARSPAAGGAGSQGQVVSPWTFAGKVGLLTGGGTHRVLAVRPGRGGAARSVGRTGAVRLCRAGLAGTPLISASH